jgi:hypothetical protein
MLLGLAQLPRTVAFAPLPAALVIRVVALNGTAGVVSGAPYSYGLEPMASHFSFDALARVRLLHKIAQRSWGPICCLPFWQSASQTIQLRGPVVADRNLQHLLSRSKSARPLTIQLRRTGPCRVAAVARCLEGEVDLVDCGLRRVATSLRRWASDRTAIPWLPVVMANGAGSARGQAP